MESPKPASINGQATSSQMTINCSNQAAAKPQQPKPLFIGVTGGTASGKTSLCDRIAKAFASQIALVSLDMFYKGLTDDQHDDAANYNFDHPAALDFDLAYEKLNELISGKDCEIPTYDFALHKRTTITSTVKTAPIIIFEGIHAIQEDRFREMMDLKIFVLTPDDIRLARRIERDIADRGRTVVDVLSQYNRFVKPAYDDFIKPTMKHADIIIPFSTQNDKAVEMLIQNLNIKMRLIEKEQHDFDNGLIKRSRTLSDVMSPIITANKVSEQDDIMQGTRLVLPQSEKSQSKIAGLFKLIQELQSQSGGGDSGEEVRLASLRLSLKELTRKLLKHCARNTALAQIIQAKVTFQPELSSMSNEGAIQLAFCVPLAFAATCREEVEEPKIFALTSACIEFNEQTSSLAQHVFEKQLAKFAQRRVTKD